ncbi:MAG: MlaD family protein [Phycisphaerae bacterium]
MPRKGCNEMVVGVFVVVALAVALTVVIWIGASDIFRTKGQLVSFYSPQDKGPAGLELGYAVSVGDVNIGRIVDMNVNDGRCIYHARLDRTDIKVYSNAEASVSSGGLVGGTKLALKTYGTPDKPLADDAHPVKVTGGLAEAMENISKGAESFKVIAAEIRAKVDPQQGGKMLANIDEIVQDLKKAAGEIVKAAANVQGQTDPAKDDSVVAKVKKAADDINAMTADAKPKVSSILSSVQDMAGRLDEYTKKDLGDFLAKLRESNNEIYKVAHNLADASTTAKDIVAASSDNIDLMVTNMTQVSGNLKSMSEEVRRNPWRLLYKPTEKETRQQDIYDAARAFSEGASQVDTAVSKLSGLAKAYPQGVPANDPTLAGALKDLKEAFGKFTKVENALWQELQKQ